jgi:tRNA(Ile)-lysidine synthase TilS/MesJ
MKICNNCVLPETFPGVTFNSEGICNHCQRFNGKKTRLADDKRRYEQKFLDLLTQLINQSTSQRSYDILMAYSGGKDSTYTMSLLRNKYKLKILAVTFDNGFISEIAIDNIRKVTDNLGIDHIFFKPQWELLKRVFSTAARQELFPRKSLERASTICTSCMGIMKSLCLKMAIEMDIPMIGYGWSPGQAPVQSSVMKLNPSMIKQTQGIIVNALKNVMGVEIKPFILDERHYKLLALKSERFNNSFLYAVHPLAFLDYSEETILKEIKTLGWKAPKDTDANSTNCLLNAFANQIHQEHYGFHPYAFEISGLVREGYMTREAGMAKLSSLPDEHIVQYVMKKLGTSAKEENVNELH